MICDLKIKIKLHYPIIFTLEWRIHKIFGQILSKLYFLRLMGIELIAIDSKLKYLYNSTEKSKFFKLRRLISLTAGDTSLSNEVRKMYVSKKTQQNIPFRNPRTI